MTELTPEAGMGLAPCPFCGGPARECHNGDVPTGMYWVLCEKCHACPGDQNTREGAITAWNTRAAAPVPHAGGEGEVEKLIADLRGVYNQMTPSQLERMDSDGDYGGHEPNEAMQLAHSLRKALTSVQEIT